jgi:putative SOS response-associated peptidase YedK
MCGRFTLRTPANKLAEHFHLDSVPQLRVRYNIAPTQDVAIVRAAAAPKQRELVMVHWGLIPSWAEDPKIGNRMINARCETAATKPSFRTSFKKRRCLIPADGFYEWQKQGSRKQPYFIFSADDSPLAFAGLWDRWTNGEQTIDSCTILTTDANDLMRPLHDRMPVILPPEKYELWLDPAVQEVARLEPLLVPCPPSRLKLYATSTFVNKPTNDTPQCVKQMDVTLPLEMKE